MTANAESVGPAITAIGDPRITRVGAFLRRAKLDELPQFLNVLTGDMSLVGPRPEHPNYVQQYSPAQRRLLRVRPGITDPASIAYRHEEVLLGMQTDPEAYYREFLLPRKLALSEVYLDQISFVADIEILCHTVGSLFNSAPSKGSRRHETKSY